MVLSHDIIVVALMLLSQRTTRLLLLLATDDDQLAPVAASFSPLFLLLCLFRANFKCQAAISGDSVGGLQSQLSDPIERAMY